MPNPATPRQKEFLRALGQKDVSSLTSAEASELIDQLLKEEKASGKTFPCPYCKTRFGPRPRNAAKCPSCKNTIIQLSGRFYTQEQADERRQKDWLAEQRRTTVAVVKDNWAEERAERRTNDDCYIVGFLIEVGDKCRHAKALDGGFVRIEDAYDCPEMLPPYDQCRHDSCECSFEPVMEDEIPKGTKGVEYTDPAQLSKLKTRENSPVSRENLLAKEEKQSRKTSKAKKESGCSGCVGCLGLLIFVIVAAAVILGVLSGP